MAPASKGTTKKAVAKYMKENYDVFQIRMPKGKKEIIKTAAENQGKVGYWRFINEAIEEKDWLKETEKKNSDNTI